MNQNNVFEGCFRIHMISSYLLLYSLNIIQSSQPQNSILWKYDVFRVKIYIFIKFKEMNIKKNISYFSDILRYVATECSYVSSVMTLL